MENIWASGKAITVYAVKAHWGVEM